VTVELGFWSMNTPEDPAPDVLAGWLEERGFESFWVGEHSHIPASRTTPYPAGGELPPQYLRMMDPFVSLTAAACATRRLLIGTGVALPLEHDLFDLAKSVATLDRLSGGRLQLGVGVGWNEEELANHRPDVPWSQRYHALAECVGALRALWAEDEPEFHGRFYDFEPVWSYPKPQQRPHPPILCGTGGRLGTTHAVAWADGWMPIDIALGDVAEKIARFREIAAAGGRDDMPITIVALGDQAPDTLRRYRDIGVRGVVVGAAPRVGVDDASATLPLIDRFAALVDELR
jgi:probable F420-dependent oxidoreductase